MKLFKRNTDHAKPNVSDKAAGWIANRILKTQNKFANLLGNISSTWKTKQQWIFLYMVWLVFGGLSTISVINAFNQKSKNILGKPATIKTPRNISAKETHPIRITDNEIRHVHVFKRTLDSLSKTPEGKIKVNKLLNRRPGLMDSLEMVEELYYSQKK